jgi:hypothetical protein
MDEYTTAETAELLANVRPDRYTAGDISWADEVIDLVADSIDAQEAKQRTAEQIVRGVEQAATRRANTVMRAAALHGALPLDWMDSASWPMSVGGHRVCLRALTADDLRQFAADEGTAASKDYAARLDAVKGARALAILLDDHRCPTVLDLGRLQAAS